MMRLTTYTAIMMVVTVAALASIQNIAMNVNALMELSAMKYIMHWLEMVFVMKKRTTKRVILMVVNAVDLISHVRQPIYLQCSKR